MGSALLSFFGLLLGTQFLYLGHAAVRWTVARRLGFRIARLRIGWGPRLWHHTTADDVKLELRLLPPLAMLAIRGHDRLPASPSHRELYGRSHLGKRLLLTLATPAYYVLLTVAPLFIVFLIAGWPDVEILSPMQVGEVAAESPALQAGIEPDDTIVSANGKAVQTLQDLIAVVSARGGMPTPIALRREGRLLTLTVTPEARSGRTVIGVTAKSVRVQRPLGVLGAAEKSIGYPGALFTHSIGALAYHTTTAMGPVALSRFVGDDVESCGFRLELAIALFSAWMVRFWLLLCVPLPFCTCGRLLLLVPEALGRTQPSAAAERSLLWIVVSGYAVLCGLQLFDDLRVL